MKQIEFYTDPRTGEAMVQLAGETTAQQLTENAKDHRDIIAERLYISKTFYTEQYAALGEIYAARKGNSWHFDFLRARRIINCCFGSNDSYLDVDSGNHQFEDVKCPIKAECKYHKVICHPKFTTTLSSREFEVLELIFKKHNSSQIAGQLFISINTVRNHRSAGYKKLSIHSTEEFVDLAHRTNMFNQ